MRNFINTLLFLTILYGCSNNDIKRNVISLNGIWEITRTDTLSGVPSTYTCKAPVPGLVDMAKPAVEPYERIYTDTSDVKGNRSIYYNNSKYWYRRTFSVPGNNPDLVYLKINKAQYHTWIYVNGKFAGENVYSFTPAIIDIKPFINETGRDNELVIAVGSRNNLPDTVVNGCDYEKIMFIPGIYDDVSLIITGDPDIINVQTVPQIGDNKVRIVAQIVNRQREDIKLHYLISETPSGKIVAEGTYRQKAAMKSGKTTSDFSVLIPDAKLWSPESPFLYRLDLSTGADNYSTRFGMRKFEVCKDSAVLLLNGKPYYMRGTNVCINRFFEDSARAGLPWDRSWVINLHKAFKYMHGNSVRYSIGFPPERWYDIADSLGILIQDEYPVWGFNMPGKPSRITSSQLASEYKEWMRERWNHPCVIIWDAQNETRSSDTVTRAILKAREMDLSHKPWDNGWTAPASDNDVTESHQYLFYPYFVKLKNDKNALIPEVQEFYKEFYSKPKTPPGGPPEIRKKPFPNPVILNEYTWLWVNRNGYPTEITKRLFERFFPGSDTPAEYLENYAKLLGMETEFWRSHRTVAGVFEFCSLGYSKPYQPMGWTCDHWKDVKTLEFDPSFVKYVRPAFNPVGVMLDYWETSPKAGSETDFRINIINDNYVKWSGVLTFTITDTEGKELKNMKVGCEIPPLGKRILTLNKIKLPPKAGHYKIIAELVYNNEPVMSIREIKIL